VAKITMNNNSIKIRLAQDSDQERWDEFILRHHNASPYHLYAWKKAIESTYRHKCIYLYAEKNNEMLGVLPLVYLHFPGIINDIVSLPFCDVGNCIGKDDEIQDALINYVLTSTKHIKGKKLQIRGDLFPSQSVKDHFQVIDTKKVRMFLDLPQSSDELLKSFKSKLRSQVRKSEKNGVSFRWGKIEDMDDAYQVFSKNMLELGSPVHSKSFLKAVLMHFGNRAKLGLAEFQGKAIGMGVLLLGGKGVSIPWASTLRDYNRLSPNMLLYWNALKFSADNGYAFFDFGRSSVSEGTYKFKQQWGAKPIPLVWYESINRQNKNSKQERTGHGKREQLAAMWQKLPLGVANFVGPHLRKYISL